LRLSQKEFGYAAKLKIVWAALLKVNAGRRYLLSRFPLPSVDHAFFFAANGNWTVTALAQSAAAVADSSVCTNCNLNTDELKEAAGQLSPGSFQVLTRRFCQE
jgi:hypothetical protein